MFPGSALHDHGRLHGPLSDRPLLKRIDGHSNVAHERADKRNVGTLQGAHPSVIAGITNAACLKLRLWPMDENLLLANEPIDGRAMLAFESFEYPIRKNVLSTRRTGYSVFAENTLAQGVHQMKKSTTKTKTQITPQGEEIPIPTHGDFLRDLKKAVVPKKSVNRPKK